MSDIILFQPSSSNDWQKLLKIFNEELALGLLHVARNTYKHFNIKIIIQDNEGNWKKILNKELKKKPIIFGTTCMTGSQIKNVIEVLKYVKSKSNVKTVLGGVHATLLPTQTLKEDYIDIIVPSEGEIKLNLIANALKKNKDLKSIKGIYYKKNKKIIYTGNSEKINLNNLDPIPYHLTNFKEKIKRINDKMGYLITSRGCINKCSFCYNSSNPKDWNSMSVQTFEKELNHLLKESDYFINYIHLLDDNFFVDIKRATQIIKILGAKKLKWYASGLSPNLLFHFDDKYLKFIKDNGCDGINVGVQSGSKKILKLMQRPTDINEIVKFNKLVKKFKIPISYEFMCGYPYETKDDLKKSVLLVKKLLKDNPNAKIPFFSIFKPYPGTKAYNLIYKIGFKQPTKFEEWADFDWDKITSFYLDKKLKILYKGVYLSSFSLTPKIFVKSKIIRLMSFLYRPLAKYRFYNLNFKFYIEYYIYLIIKKFFNIK
jgi:anaerobic magnesium-protoporphyrin IX monomethyl ester cyclase